MRTRLHRLMRSSLSWQLMALIAAETALVGVLLWGGLEASDPLIPYIPQDKMRHVLGFATLGLCAAFTPGRLAKLVSIALAIGFAGAFEIAQGLFSTREMSKGDFVASACGVFAGFGAGAALLSAVEIAREFRDRLSAPARAAKRVPPPR